MRRRKAAALILTAVILAAQAAGVPAGEVQAAETGAAAEVLPDFGASEETVLTVMWESDYSDPKTQDPFYRWVQSSFESWEEKEGITLELLPAAAREGTAEAVPDLLVGDSASLMEEAQSGALADLSMDVAEYGEWSWYYEAAQDLACASNGIYGVPFEAKTAGLWYDAQALAAAGIIDYDEEEDAYEAWEPESFQEITDACKKLMKADRNAFFADLQDPLFYELVLRGCGGRLVTGEGSLVVESKEIGSALSLIAALAKQSGTTAGKTTEADEEPEEAVLRAGFTAPEGTEQVTGFAAMPSEAGNGPVSLVQGKLLGIPAQAQDRELAFSFLCHMMSKELYSAYIAEAAASGSLSVRRDVQEIEEIDDSRENSLRQTLLTGAGLYHPLADEEAAESCIREMLETVCANPTDAGIREAQETYAEAMREAFGEEKCRPRAETEEEEEE